MYECLQEYNVGLVDGEIYRGLAAPAASSPKHLYLYIPLCLFKKKKNSTMTTSRFSHLLAYLWSVCMNSTVFAHPGLKNEHTIHLVRGSNTASGANTSSTTATGARGSDRPSAPSPPGSGNRSNGSPGATGGLFPGFGTDMNEMQRQVSRQRHFLITERTKTYVYIFGNLALRTLIHPLSIPDDYDYGHPVPDNAKPGYDTKPDELADIPVCDEPA